VRKVVGMDLLVPNSIMNADWMGTMELCGCVCGAVETKKQGDECCVQLETHTDIKLVFRRKN